MNTYNNSVVVKFDTKVNGNAGVLAPVTVYITGTTTKASLFSPTGDPIDNPVFTNSTGNYTFDIEDGTYDIVINEGFLSVVRLDKQQIAAVQTQSIITASYDNLQIAKQANITTGAVITTAGYYAANDGGAGQYIVVAQNTGTDDGGSYLDMVNGNQLELIIDNVNITQWGVPDVSFQLNAERLNKLCDWAYANGIYSIKCDVDATIDPAAHIKNKSNVMFYGSGSLTGLYRVIVHKTINSNIPTFNNINESQLGAFNRSENPKVVIMGDSISTAGEGAQGPNAVAYGESMWSVITKKIQNDIPSKNISFVNRGIGGQTWLNANDNVRPSVGVTPWYTDNKAWLDYIEEQKPDLLFLAFGMNDSNGFNAGAMTSVVDKIKLWGKVPSIVFVTNPVPSLAALFPDGTGFGFVGSVFQEGRDQVASYTRCYSEFFNYGYLDVNRMFTIVRDGYDTTTSNLIRVDTDIAPDNGVYTASASARDFSITGSISGTQSEIKDIFDGVNGVLTCRVGLSSNDLVFIGNTAKDTIQVSLFTDGLSTYKIIDTQIPLPTTDFTLTFDVSNNKLTLLLDDTTITTTKLIRQATIMTVQLGYQGFATGPFDTITFNRGLSRSVGKSGTDSEIWGVSDLTADTKFPNGGNGINHFASLGIEKVILPALDMTNFGSEINDRAEVSPYPFTINEHFSNWTGAEIDDWPRLTSSFGIETVGGVHGAPKSIEFSTYPCGYAQDVTAKLSREISNYNLVIVAKNGASYGNTSAGWVNPHNTLIVIEWNDGSPQSLTVNVPEFLFGSDWSQAVFNIAELASEPLPPLSQLTKMEVRVYLTSGAFCGYIGIHEYDSTSIVFKNPLF